MAAPLKTMDAGLLVLRVGIGIMFMKFGYPKITGGPETWTGLGAAMGAMGITFAPAMWGFMAAFAEFVGGLMLALGILVRPFAFLMAGTMLVATAMLVSKGAELKTFGHALDMCIVFTALIITGGGRLVLSRFIPGLKGHWFG